MVSRVIAVVIDCHDAGRLAGFWSCALDAGEPQRWRDGQGIEYVQLDDVSGPTLVFQPVPEPKTVKNRLHLDLAPPAEVTQADEIERLVELGAGVIADDPDLPWVLLADPEGNEFCVLPPRNEG